MKFLAATNPELDLQVGDDIPILIPQSFGAFQGETTVKNITESGQTLITLELRDTLRGKEDRKFYRLPVSLDLGYSPQGPDPQFTRSRTVDISAGGVRFYVVRPAFPVGCALRVSFNLGTGSAGANFLLLTKVMHTQPLNERNTVGVKFIDIPPSKQELISDYVATQYEEQEETEEPRVKRSVVAGLGYGRTIEYEQSVRVFLRWCRQRQVRPSWVILHDMHEFRDWLAMNGYTKREIDRWIEHIIAYL